MPPRLGPSPRQPDFLSRLSRAGSRGGSAKNLVAPRGADGAAGLLTLDDKKKKRASYASGQARASALGVVPEPAAARAEVPLVRSDQSEWLHRAVRSTPRFALDSPHPPPHHHHHHTWPCLLYTSPSPRDAHES
eukprot:6767473-Prymnesium_polylepis.1